MANEKSLQEHCQRSVWVLAENHHSRVDHAKRDAAQNAQNDAVHGKTSRSLAADLQIVAANDFSFHFRRRGVAKVE